MDLIGLLGNIAIHSTALISIVLALFSIFVTTLTWEFIFPYQIKWPLSLDFLLYHQIFVAITFLLGSAQILYAIHDLHQGTMRRWAASRRRAAQPRTDQHTVPSRQHDDDTTAASPDVGADSLGPVPSRRGMSGVEHHHHQQQQQQQQQKQQEQRDPGHLRDLASVDGRGAGTLSVCCCEELLPPGGGGGGGSRRRGPDGMIRFRAYVEDVDAE